MAIPPQSIYLITTTVAFKNPFSIISKHNGLVITSLRFIFFSQAVSARKAKAKNNLSACPSKGICNWQDTDGVVCVEKKKYTGAHLQDYN